MAAGFKTATVNASDVAASLTDYPSYVDLSRIGITTLAEAQSVRVYADSGKTTEWAREIVSVSEMHVKIPSLTTTTVIYVDYDGIRADYAVGATYGRNAVWSDYAAVYHMNNDPSGSAPQLVDSTGNGNNGTSNGSMTSDDLVTGSIGDATRFDTTNDYYNIPDSATLDVTQITIQGWCTAYENSDNDFFIKPASATWSAPFVSYYLRFQTRSGGGNDGVIFAINGGGTYRQAGLTTETLSLDTPYFFHGTYDGSTLRAYRDGVQKGTTGYAGSITTSSQPLIIGNNIRSGAYVDTTQDEHRIRGTAVSGDWITTEYNNQSDEATFWGTWTDAGGGVTRRVFNIS
jgi:hypothetical protein